jgi:hypothetical protein
VETKVQLQSVKPELQLQLNLTAWASWWILPIAKNSQNARRWRREEGSEGKRGRKQEVETQAQTVRLPNLYTTWMGHLVRVTHNGLTQSVFILDRVKSSSCDCPEKIPVDVCSNARCFMCFSSGSSSPKVSEFCPTLRLVYFIARA